MRARQNVDIPIDSQGREQYQVLNLPGKKYDEMKYSVRPRAWA
jgi:hypothetical protein